MSDVMADRTPPHNIEAEQAVLGAILIDQDALTSASELLVPDSFYRTKHQKIFEVMLGLSDKGEPIDLVMMTSAMADQGITRRSWWGFLLSRISRSCSDCR